MSDHRPIFVVGFQRSGTTLLQSLLGSHPNIAAPPETYFLFRIARLADYYGDLRDDATLRRVLHDAVNPPADLFAACGFDEDVLFERVKVGERTMRAVFVTILDDFAQRQGKGRWSEKTPGQTAGEILATFPDAQLVHIVRDPRDVIASSLKTPWTPPDAYRLALSWKTFLRSTVRAGLRAGPDSFLQVRYEDLTRDPVTVLTQVFTFLGEGFDPEILDDPSRRATAIAQTAEPWQNRVLEAIQPAAEGGWKASLTAKDRRLAAAALHGEIAALGYEQTGDRGRYAGMVLAVPRILSMRREARKLRGTAQDPHRRYELTQEYMAKNELTVRAADG